MGYRGSEGSRTPADWHSQRSGRPRSYSASPATEPTDSGSGAPGGPGAFPDHGADDEEAGYGTGEWAAGREGDAYGGEATQGHGTASRGPARGFPPEPGQPDPVYPHDDFDVWSDGTGPHAEYTSHPGHQEQWDPAAASGEWESPVASGERETAAGHWDAAPVGQWESTGDQSEHWEQGDHWDQDEAAQPWGEGSGHWDAPYGRWDENGEWRSPNEDDGTGGGPEGAVGREGLAGNGHRASPYDRADFAIAGRDADRWDSADYPAYGGYPDEPAAVGEPDAGRRDSRRRDGRGRKAAASPLADPGPGGPGGPRGPGGPGRGRGTPRKEPRGAPPIRTRTIGLTAAGVVVIAALAAVAFALLRGHSGHSGAATESSPGLSAPKLPSPSASGSLGTSGASRLGNWGYITGRASDAAPLTVAELYPAQFLITGSSFVRTTGRADTDCNQALFGTQLQNAAKAYGCSQVVRASYISGGQTMMGTIGVVNLSSANDAAKAGNASGPNDFVTPLDGKTGPTRNLSQGTGVVQAEDKGHYLILIWAEFANLKAPTTTAQRAQLEQFASGLISGSANIALSNRMVSGHPEVTGTPG